MFRVFAVLMVQLAKDRKKAPCSTVGSQSLERATFGPVVHEVAGSLDD